MGHHPHLATGQNTFSKTFRHSVLCIVLKASLKHKSGLHVALILVVQLDISTRLQCSTSFRCLLWLVFCLSPVDRTLPAHWGRGCHDGVGVDRRRPGCAWRKNE